MWGERCVGEPQSARAPLMVSQERQGGTPPLYSRGWPGCGQCRGPPRQAGQGQPPPPSRHPAAKANASGLAGSPLPAYPRTDLLSCLLKTRPSSGPSGLPLSIFKLGNAELSPAWGIGALDRGVAGDVVSHVLHQLLQLSTCRGRGSETGSHVLWSLISR